jgi:hypothetical protein
VGGGGVEARIGGVAAILGEQDAANESGVAGRQPGSLRERWWRRGEERESGKESQEVAHGASRRRDRFVFRNAEGG